MRRPPCYATRPLPPIERMEWPVRTLHPFRPLVLAEGGVRLPLTLDRIEIVTLARVRFLERVAA
ncbi:hypothetical protein [Xanthobacter sp.]|uniref:hypothetical protein n=1 Tax=Xanthobacter sp. TaxID=35809 RepID=UPI0026007DED|nr:hypothetical protein [Xanthobacter sp.]